MIENDNYIVYSRQQGKPKIPATVRINWLADGAIKPLMYWTPDNSCYEVKSILDVTPLAYLDEKGEGIRIRVASELLESLDLYPAYQGCQHEVYLYFADKFFSGKNFVDERYDHENKKYIPMVLDVFQNGEYELVHFKVNEAEYMVERTISVEPRISYRAGGAGICHKVEAKQISDEGNSNLSDDKSTYRLAAIFFEVNKWFVAC